MRDWLKVDLPKLRGVKIGREWRIIERELEAFLARALGPQPPATAASEPEAVEAPTPPLRIVPPALPEAPPPPAVPPSSYDQRKAEMVAHLRTLRAQRLSYQAIANQLNAAGVPTLTGRGSWKKGTIGNLLQEEG